MKRVASDTLRGARDIGTVCFLESDCFAIFGRIWGILGIDWYKLGYISLGVGG